jgi:hypothetical protein
MDVCSLYLHVAFLLALEERLAASLHEKKAAHLLGFIIVEEHMQAVVAGIRQRTNVFLASMQLRTG